MSARGKPLTVGIDGLGYMGLASGLGFAAHGWPVVGYDILPRVREQVSRGRSPYTEPGLEDLLRRQVRSHRFRVVSDVETLAESADVIFLCLPTPSQRSGRIDLAAIRSGSRALGRALRNVRTHRVVVVKSTVVPGTTETIVAPALLRAAGNARGSISIASNPEFLAEGSMVHDAVHPDRIVIGTTDPTAQRTLRRLYAPFGAPLVSLTPSGAELTKYASNAFLAMKVTFANELSRAAESVGSDIDQVMDAVGQDPRIGGRFLRAGPGYGGSCFDKDVRALRAFLAERELPSRLASATLTANDDQSEHVWELVRRAQPHLRGRRVALLGLAFKSGTDDVRESRAFPLIERLLRAGALVRAHDPAAIPRFRREWVRRYAGASSARLRFVERFPQVLDGADLAILHTDWPAYGPWTRSWTSRMRHPILVDLRRHVSPGAVARAGLRRVALGIGAGPSAGTPRRRGTA